MKTRFGIFVLPVVSGESSDEAQRALKDAVADVEMAERLGFETAWIAEHHGTPYGGVCPSAITMISHLAGRTSSIRLGTAASILPLHNPIRLAEEALFVDHIASGRLELGVGRGFLAVDFNTLGIDMANRHQLFEQGLQVIREATGHVPKMEAPRLLPPRFQSDPIPLWGAAATSLESISMFAKAGIGLMLNPYTRTMTEVEQAISTYHSILKAAGYPESSARVLIHELLFVAETEESAIEKPREYLLAYLGSLKMASGASGTTPQHGTGPAEYADLLPKMAFGTPTVIRDRIASWAAIGVTDFAFSIRFGGMPSEMVANSVRLFSTEIVGSIPAQSRMLPSRSQSSGGANVSA